MNFTKNKFISLLLLFLVNLSKATEIEKSCDGQVLAIVEKEKVYGRF
jgi:hypothetical protein